MLVRQRHERRHRKRGIRGGSRQRATGSQRSGATGAGCGTYPQTMPSDPDGVLAKLPATLRQFVLRRLRLSGAQEPLGRLEASPDWTLTTPGTAPDPAGTYDNNTIVGDVFAKASS